MLFVAGTFVLFLVACFVVATLGCAIVFRDELAEAIASRKKQLAESASRHEHVAPSHGSCAKAGVIADPALQTYTRDEERDDRGNDLRALDKAVAECKAALLSVTREAEPSEWASIQVELANAMDR